jgi:1-deoxy-D-xylulose-5-phosphate reductoisomerase
VTALSRLEFEMPDAERFPALRIAREALESGGAATNILSAANEIAVTAFLAGRVGFLEIARIVEETLGQAADLPRQAPASIDEAVALDAEARRRAEKLVAQRPATTRT